MPFFSRHDSIFSNESCVFLSLLIYFLQWMCIRKLNSFVLYKMISVCKFMALSLHTRDTRQNEWKGTNKRTTLKMICFVLRNKCFHFSIRNKKTSIHGLETLTLFSLVVLNGPYRIQFRIAGEILCICITFYAFVP